MDGPGRGHVPRSGRRPVRRRLQGQGQRADRASQVHRAAIGRNRHAVAQHHADADPRHHAGPDRRGRELL
ncbi:hypothetical protein G6F35_019118 [Rhizopus arrhizus]|nr:hypothetical protein G6F35_019118 [Rhizopus arrhizus]